MGAKQSKRSVDISGKEAEGGGEVAVAGAGGEGRVEQLADADALKPQLNGAIHIEEEQTDKEKELDSGTPENEKDATTEKEAKEEDDKDKEAAPVTNGESEPKENGESTPTLEDGKKPKKEKVKKKWSLRSISFSRKDKPKQEKKQKDEEIKTNGEPEKVPEETAEATPETVANEVAEEAKAPVEEKDEKTPETPVTEPLTNGSSTPESKAETPAEEAAAPEPSPAAPEPDQLPLNGLSLDEPKPQTPEVEITQETKPEPPAAETPEIIPVPEIPKEVCVEQMPLLEPTPPPLPANPPPSSVASFAATTMAPELTDASLPNTADGTIAPLSAQSATDAKPETPTAVTVTDNTPQIEAPSLLLKESNADSPAVTTDAEPVIDISVEAPVTVDTVPKELNESPNIEIATVTKAAPESNANIPTPIAEDLITAVKSEQVDSPRVEAVIIEPLESEPVDIVTPDEDFVKIEAPIVESSIDKPIIPETVTETTEVVEIKAEILPVKESVVAESRPELENFSEPEVKVSEQEVKISEHEVIVSEPEVKVPELEVKVPELEVEVTEPEVKSSDPGVKVSEPDVKLSEPEINATALEVKVSELEVKASEPGVKVPVSEVKVSEPEVQVSEPEVQESEQEVQVLQPKVKASEQEELVSEPEVQVSEPEKQESEPEISEAEDSSLPPPPALDDAVETNLDEVDEKVQESLKLIPDPIAEAAPSAQGELTNGVHDSDPDEDAEKVDNKKRAASAAAQPAAAAPPADTARITPQEPAMVTDKLADLIPELPEVPELNTETLQQTASDVAVAN